MANLSEYVELLNKYNTAMEVATDTQYMGTMREQHAAWEFVTTCSDNIKACLGMTPGELERTVKALKGTTK